MLKEILPSQHKCVTMGDFNLPNIDWTLQRPTPAPGNTLTQLLADNNLTQHVPETTRQKNILDLKCAQADSYPELPHRQCVGLVFRRSHVRISLSAVSIVICSPARIAVCNRWSSGGTALVGCGVQPVNWIYRL